MAEQRWKQGFLFSWLALSWRVDGVLFAPKSVEDTREYLSKRADDGEFAAEKATELA